MDLNGWLIGWGLGKVGSQDYGVRDSGVELLRRVEVGAEQQRGEVRERAIKRRPIGFLTRKFISEKFLALSKSIAILITAS